MNLLEKVRAYAESLFPTQVVIVEAFLPCNDNYEGGGDSGVVGVYADETDALVYAQKAMSKAIAEFFDSDRVFVSKGVDGNGFCWNTVVHIPADCKDPCNYDELSRFVLYCGVQKLHYVVRWCDSKELCDRLF